MGFIIELCRLYGIRAIEMGYLAAGIDIQAEKNGGELPDVLPNNFIRMVIPANVYQKDHMDYVVNAVSTLAQDLKKIPSVKIVSGKFDIMRVFSVVYEPYNH
jgi:tryptophanase